MKRITLLIFALIAVAGFSQTHISETGIISNAELYGNGVTQSSMRAPCSYLTPSEGFPNAANISDPSTFTGADDFVVAAGDNYTPQSVVLPLLTTAGSTISAVEVTFYSDAASLPGGVLGTLPLTAPTSQVMTGTAFGRDIIEVTMDLTPVGLTLPAGTYWMGLRANNSLGNTDLFWEMTTTIVGIENSFSLNDGATWGTGSSVFGTPWDFVFFMTGDCVFDTVCGAGNPQPVPPAGTGGFPCVGGPTTSDAAITEVGVIGSGSGEYVIESVEIDITHTWDSDLEIDLISPDGTVWDLSSDNGGAGDNYTGTVFIDGFPSITTGAPPFTGTFQAEQGPMNTGFAGDNVFGNWTLSICDDAGGDVGTLNSYCITFGKNPVSPIINCPMPDPLIVDTDPGVCTAQVAFTDAVAIDPEGGTVTVVQTMGPPSGSDFPLGDTIIEFTATDEQGDQSTCQFTITVEDNEPPIVTCPNDITQDSDPGICGAVVNYPAPMVMDNCFSGGGTATYDQTINITNPVLASSNDFFFTGAQTGATIDATLNVTAQGDLNGSNEVWEILDEDGNTVGTIGNTGPQCTAVLNASFNIPMASIDAWAADGQIDFNVFDQQGGINVTLCASNFLEMQLTYDYSASSAPYTVITGFPSGDVFPVGTTLTTLEYTDPGGNSVQCTFNVTVNDVEAPTVTCIGQPATVTDTEGAAPGTPISDTLPPTVSTITVTDDVAITDLNVDLDISHTWVSDMTITLESPMGTVVTIFDGPADGCSGDNIVDTYDDESANPLACMTPEAYPLADYQPSNPLSAFDTEQTLGDWILTITDGVGGDDGVLNSWALIWTYDDPGTPLDVILDSNGMATIPATDLVSGFDDNCGAGGVTITAGGVGGAPMELPTTLAGGNGNFGNMFDINALTPVIIQSFDIHGDTGAVFDVEVYAKSGTWVGSEDVPGDWTLIGTAPGVVSNGDGVVTPLNLTLNYVIPSGETHAFYVTPTDFSTGGFNYTNGTATGNVFASDANIEFLEGAGKNYPFTGTTFQPRVFNGSIHYEAGGVSGTTVDFTCDDLGLTQVIVTATDMAGNESTCTATVNVIDNTPPVLVCMDVTIEIGPNGTTDIEPEDLLASSPTTYDVISISSDNQSGTEGFTDFTVPVTAADVVSFDWDYTTPDGAAFDGFGYLLNGVFTELTDPAGPNDQSGNSGPIAVAPGDVFGFRSQSDDGIFGAATTTISGFVPGFSGQFDPANWTLTLTNSDGDAFFVEIPGGPLSFDACGITVMAVSVNEVTCDDIANSPLTVTVFASDASGNLAACQSMVTVVDLLGPEVTCPADMTVDPGPGNLFYTVPDYWAQGDATAVDNCTDPLTIFSQDPAAGSQISDGVYTVSICSTDEYGNQGCCTFELTVESILGADDNALNQAISMYPNPAQEYVTIANGSSILLDNAMIYDVNGKLVNQIDLRNMGSEKVIDVSNLASGVYMVQITSERSSVIKRLLKE